MKTLTQMGSDAKKASTYLAKLGIKERNNALLKVADALVKRSDYIREANAIDLANGKKNNMSTALLDRLMLTESRIEGMADGLRVLAGLDDPIGEVKSMKTRPNGLMIGKKTVPLGVVAIIYESRPNVTADAFGLCFKSANACTGLYVLIIPKDQDPSQALFLSAPSVCKYILHRRIRLHLHHSEVQAVSPDFEVH